MKPFLQLNLQSSTDRVDATNLSKPVNDQPQAPVSFKKLNRIANRAAHKAASVYGRSGSSILSK